MMTMAMTKNPVESPWVTAPSEKGLEGLLCVCFAKLK